VPPGSWPTITKEVSTGKLFVSVMLRLVVAPVYGTIINGGCQVVLRLPVRFVVLEGVPRACATPFVAVQVAPTAAAVPVPPAVTAVPVPQTQPHIGTLAPSGRIVVCLAAVRLTCAEETPAVTKRMVTASTAFFRAALR